MIYLDQEKLDQFLKAVANSFTTTPEQVLLFFAILAAVLSFLILFYLLQRRRVHRQLSSQSASKYAELIERHKLIDAEVEMIEEMAEYLPAEKQKYLLLTNQHLFNVCAGRMKSRRRVSETTLASLRLKLGFGLEQPDEIPSSSVELPTGLPVHLYIPGRRGIRGRIAARESRGLIISLESEAAAGTIGTEVRVFFKIRSGIYSFSSAILNASRGKVILRHSEEIAQYQRRSYFRRSMNLTVFVNPFHEREKSRRSTLLDLGGGGASLVNPQKTFREGDQLELTFAASGSRFRVPARVMRTSKGSSVLHVEFTSMAESVRDRIIGSLYRITQL